MVSTKAAWPCLWVIAIKRPLAFECQAFLKVARSFWEAATRTAFGAKISTRVGCQACISVPLVVSPPSTVNSSRPKIQRFPCRRWGVGVFGQAPYSYLALSTTSGEPRRVYRLVWEIPNEPASRSIRHEQEAHAPRSRFGARDPVSGFDA